MRGAGHQTQPLRNFQASGSQRCGVKMNEERPETVSLHLIDAADGRSLQIWSFSTPRITIGRGEGESLVLADPYISRVHAELVGEGGEWELISRGRNGVYIDGRSVTACPLPHGSTFRLGQNGPTFRFLSVPHAVGTATLCFDPSAFVVLALNRQAVEQETKEIAETEYFRHLQQKARDLRRHRTPNMT